MAKSKDKSWVIDEAYVNYCICSSGYAGWHGYILKILCTFVDDLDRLCFYDISLFPFCVINAIF